MSREYVVVLPLDGGALDVLPMRKWVKDNPHVLPGLDLLTNNSIQVGLALVKQGWRRQETYTQIRFLSPGAPSSAVLAGEEAAVEPVETGQDGHYFRLERELQYFLAANLPRIEVIPGKRLRVYMDQAEREGVEFQTGVGRIDILAVDEAGDFYVFELKRADSSDEVLGQVARYMGWMRRTIGEGKNVYGVIVARQITEKLRYAASVVPGVHLFQYEVSFKLQPAHEFA